jgi:hypothetical protein
MRMNSGSRIQHSTFNIQNYFLPAQPFGYPSKYISSYKFIHFFKNLNFKTMKTKILIAAFAALLLGFTSCKKDSDPNIKSGLDASKTSDIKLGEPVVFKLAEADASAIVNWTVTPNTDVQIQPSGKTASILFGNPGSYSVSAISGNIQGRTDVIVEDSVYNPGGGDTPTYEPLTGDQIFITVTRYDSMGISGLDFRYITEKKYNCLNHTLLVDNIFSGQDLKIDFKSVFIPSEEFCTAGEDYASGGTAWYPVEDGNHGLQVVLDGQIYTGSFVKNGSTFTFTWPYNSGVTLTPVVIN